VLETIAWIAYLVPVLALFLLPGRTAQGTSATAPAPTVATETTEHVDQRA
jgi:high-affinity iron transporter